MSAPRCMFGQRGSFSAGTTFSTIRRVQIVPDAIFTFSGLTIRASTKFTDDPSEPGGEETLASYKQGEEVDEKNEGE